MKSTFSGWRYLWKSPDIRRKLLITLGLLGLFRLAANIPAPGVNPEALRAFTESASSQGTFLGFLDLLSGGTVSRFSVLAMGVYPYITAQIILQLLTPIIPALQQRMKDDPREGRKWMEKWTYLLAVPMAALSAIGQINIINALAPQPLIEFGLSGSALLPSITVLLSMTAGTMFAIWLGELISEYGIRGQGLSLIIFAGIVSQMPNSFKIIIADPQNRVFLLVVTVVIMVATIFAIVFVQAGRRNVPVMYPGRRVGNRMSMPVKGTLPLMVNMAGMIPLIFASALLQFPAIVSSYFQQSDTEWIQNFAISIQTFFTPTGINSWGYWLTYFLMVVIFAFFYTDVLFAQQNYGENLKKAGAQIPGVNRGPATQKYLTRVQRRITFPGAFFLGLIAIMPFLIQLLIPAFRGNSGIFLVTSAGLLIVVGVVRDTFSNIDAELKMHGYQDSLLVR
ncbi:MAG: preprotein translocase subunit SecY [Anaerolineae bacterium]|nr:preprotein translocase subunit SecY [Anaerolineae bacterium]